ncbi:hypothetical protein [Flavobacterium agrisoli]|uniref:Glycerophosphoryl diester phosphodiesterase membrane domain-containing protein n=1 Tax=Flavobacterium agrisoli TaxID=2793066 RepID=A0A934UIF6_9FLAO|nr:hypothetical protein [Flavobacterium agrisoli]MBK0368762.1 hypothetical protein [Flavobacterium agrisoli]
MFQLYKKRNFSDYISDTISFFKQFGGHYFKNYLLINGGFLLILSFLLYFLIKVYFEVLFSSIGTSNSNYFIQYFDSNAGLFIGSLVFFIVLIVIISLLNFAFPVLYLRFLSENQTINFSSKEIISQLIQNTGRILLFFLGMLFLVFPLLMLLFILLFVMIFILIGLPLLLVAIPASLAWINFSFYSYLSEKTSFFESLRIGFNMVKQKFWAVTGTTMVVLILIQIIQGIITMIPYFIGMVYFFTSANNSVATQDGNPMTSLGLFATVIMILGILFSYFSNNLILINQGIMYYSLCEENTGVTLLQDIDLIGTHDE